LKRTFSAIAEFWVPGFRNTGEIEKLLDVNNYARSGNLKIFNNLSMLSPLNPDLLEVS